MPDREEVLLDAAIKVLATGGLRRLTHRAVDAQAGLPTGSTSNLFRTREALLAAILRGVLDRELTLWTRTSSGSAPRDVEEFARQFGTFLMTLSSSEAELTSARHALFTEAVLQPELREELHVARRQLVEWLTPALTDLGSRAPSEDARHLLALIDGLLSSQLVDPMPDFDPGSAIAALLHGLLGTAVTRPDH